MSKVRFNWAPKRGAQSGNRNALKTGQYSQALRDIRSRARHHIAALKLAMARLKLAHKVQQTRKTQRKTAAQRTAVSKT